MLVCLPLLQVTCPACAAAAPRELKIQAGEHLLHGCYRTPEDPGRFPVMTFNHGSEKDGAPCGPPDLGDLTRDQGFAFLTVQRHRHGRSPGEYIMDLQQRAFLAHPQDRSAAQGEVVGLHKRYNEDVEAAVAWIKQQSRTWRRHSMRFASRAGRRFYR
jgi:hypothetical protein